jgi:hypothetical protein
MSRLSRVVPTENRPSRTIDTSRDALGSYHTIHNLPRPDGCRRAIEGQHEGTHWSECGIHGPMELGQAKNFLSLRSGTRITLRTEAPLAKAKKFFGWAMLFNSHHDCGECCRLVAKLLSATTEVVSFQRYATACSKAGLLVPPAREQCYRDATTAYNTALGEIRRHRSSHGQPFTPRAKAIPFRRP